jgi:hypothetical protein
MDGDSSSQLAPPDYVSADATDAVPEGSNRSAIQRLGEAVIAVAKRPSRDAYATWMRIVEPAWIAPLVGVAAGLFLLDSAISLGIRTLLTAPGPSTATLHYRFGAPSPLDQVINSLVINPLLGILNLAVTIYIVAALMPAERGSLKERAFQVARPFLLAQLVVTTINIVIGEPIFALGLTTVGKNPLVGLMIILLNLAIGLYALVAALNALAAGSDRSRWLLFGIMILVGIASILVGWYGLGALFYQFGIHLPVAL